MPVVTEEHRAAQRARILAATLQVVRTKGMSRLAMSDIIAGSGMSAGAIYGYFAGKDDLVFALAEWLVGGRLDALEEAAAERPVPPPEEAFRRIFAGLPEGFLADGVVLQIWAEGLTNARIRVLALRTIKDLYAAAGRYLRSWLEVECGFGAAEAQALAEATAPALVALAQGFIVQAGLLDDFAAEAYVPSIRALAETIATSPH